ncbi:MAG: hypothetical protein QME66_04265 [Candidatus Eisenbacteria bacterium]|nr:hypothetical protein [Candidatus Eisenbacteria bacterium]
MTSVDDLMGILGIKQSEEQKKLQWLKENGFEALARQLANKESEDK